MVPKTNQAMLDPVHGERRQPEAQWNLGTKNLLPVDTRLLSPGVAITSISSSLLDGAGNSIGALGDQPVLKRP
jgi:hypothetical protein